MRFRLGRWWRSRCKHLHHGGERPGSHLNHIAFFFIAKWRHSFHGISPANSHPVLLLNGLETNRVDFRITRECFENIAAFKVLIFAWRPCATHWVKSQNEEQTAFGSGFPGDVNSLAAKYSNRYRVPNPV